MAITVEAVHRKVQYTSTGSAGPYSFSFKVLAATDIKVSVGATVKTVTTHYTTAYSADGTGSVTFTSGNEPASDAIVTIESNQAIARTTDYTTGGDFTASSINDALDRLTINDQQIETELSRNIQLASTTTRTTSGTGTSGPLTWPYDATASNNASKVIAYDSNGTALELGPTTTAISGASTSATNAASSATAAASSASTASTQATLSTNYATKINGAVTGTDFSSKAWAIGGTNVTTTASRGAAKEWATTTGGAVDTSEYSAKEYAVGTTATSAKTYATKVDGAVTGTDFSAKAWAIGGTNVTSTGSRGAAKEWATTTGAAVDTSEYSAKEYAVGSTVAAGSAKEWALGGGGSFTEGTEVTSGLYSARKYASDANGYAQAAASGQLYSSVENKSSNFTVNNGDDGKYFIVDTSSGPVTVTLSAIGSDDGRRFAFQKSHASNSLIFDPQGSDTINGSASNYTITENSEVVILVADNGGADGSSADNWVATINSQTVAGAGLSKTGSTMSLDLTNDQAWTGSQRSTPVADNDGNFDMNAGNNFNWTPTGADVIEFTNETAGQGGLIYLVNGSGHTITKGSEVKCDANFLATVSAAGNYLISYYSFDGTSVVVANTLAVS